MEGSRWVASADEESVLSTGVDEESEVVVGMGCGSGDAGIKELKLREVSISGRAADKGCRPNDDDVKTEDFRPRSV